LNYTIYEQYYSGDYAPPTEPSLPDFKVLRGGDWGTTYNDRHLRCADRDGFENNDRVAGFRIVFDL